MAINWNYYLSRYQQARGGHFFGALDDEYDCHMTLIEGEDTPLLVWIDTDPADGCYEHNVLARAMVQLDGEYDLHIHPRSLMGGGFMSMASLVKGGLEYDQSEATRGRVMTCSDKHFFRQILDDPGVTLGLSTWKKVSLRIRPAPQKEQGWHVVEIVDINFEGNPVNGSHWICQAMLQDISWMDRADQERVLQEGADHFITQMDAFLNFLRAASRAAVAWKK